MQLKSIQKSKKTLKIYIKLLCEKHKKAKYIIYPSINTW